MNAVVMVFVRLRCVMLLVFLLQILTIALSYHLQCSFCHKDDSIADCTQDSHFCLTQKDDGLELKRDHAYFYQVCFNYTLMKTSNACVHFYRSNANCSVQRGAIVTSSCGQSRKYTQNGFTPMRTSGWRIWLQ